MRVKTVNIFTLEGDEISTISILIIKEQSELLDLLSI